MAIDKEALAQKILEIEGLTSEERSELLGLIREKKNYGLVWEDKPEDAEKLMKQYLPTLKEDPTKYIPGSSPDSPNHIIIEGDNLHALTSLMFTHEGKIDVIYIDPPYNTGNKDFVYNDAYVDKEDDYRHSKWLSFMAKRLFLAKQLLSDRGVIFISIDDNEQAQIKLLCDEIFGNENFIAQLIWKKKQGGGNDSNFIVTEHEYVFIYAKRLTNVTINVDKKYKLDDNLYPLKDDKGDYGLITLDKASIRFSESLVFPIYDSEGQQYLPRIVNGKQSCWRWSKKKVEEEYKDLVFKKGKVYTKYYRPKGIKPKSLLIDPIYGRTESGHDDIIAVLGRTSFSYPKPLLLINHLLSISTFSNSIILDFFAGSGTTLHATMQLNAEDGGKRQCILVNINENGICENVTYERNKRVIEGYTTPKGNHVPGLTDNSLHYYRTELKVPREKTTASMRQLMEAATDMLCIKHDLYEEKHFFGGRKLKPQYSRYFDNGKGARMLIIYNELMIEHIVPLIAEMELDEGVKIQVYVFSPSSDPFTQEFEEVMDKVELCSMPTAICNVYKRVLKPLEPEWLQGAKPQEESSTQTEEL